MKLGYRYRSIFATLLVAAALHGTPALALIVVGGDPAKPPRVAVGKTQAAPGKGTVPSCKGAYPAPAPYWIDSNYVAYLIEQHLKNNPGKPVFKMAIYSNDRRDALGVDVEFPSGGADNRSVVVLINQVKSAQERAMRGVNGAQNCVETFLVRAPHLQRSAPTEMASATTTWLELRKPPGSGAVWNTVFRWNEQGFWQVFGGRRVIIRWVAN